MVYLFLADGFEETEALCPYDLLLRAGVDIKTVSVNGDKAVTGTHGIKVFADFTLNEIEAECDGVILPGGMPGASNLDANKRVDEIMSKAYSEGKIIGAICAAPFILGKRNMLSGKEATCFPGFEDKLSGAIISEKAVVKSGNIITAKGMGVAFEFGLKLVEAFCSTERMLKIISDTQAQKCIL